MKAIRQWLSGSVAQWHKVFLRTITCLVLVVFFTLCHLATWPLNHSKVFAAIPWMINYQGRLTDTGGKAISGTYTITFRLYDASTSGTKVWEEQQTVTLGGSDNGIFSVVLGSVTVLDSVDFNNALWLSIQVADDAEMTPRQRLTATGYAMNADQVDGLDSSKFMRTDLDSSTSGKVTITRAGAALLIKPSTAPSADTKMIEFQNAAGTSKFSVDSEGDVTVAGDLAVSGTISGSTSTTGTTNTSWTVGSGTNAAANSISLLFGQSSGQESLVFQGASTGDFVLSDDLRLDGQSALRFVGSSGTNYVAFQAPASISSNVTWTLPSADGSANQILTTNGSGTLAWQTASGLSGVGDITDIGDCASGACFSSGGTGTSLVFKNATSGTITLQTVSGALGTRTLSLPAVTGTVVSTGDTDSVTNTMLAGSIAASKLVGTDIATVGTITTGTWTGTKVGLAYGGTNADLSATGGTGQVLKQTSAGAAITVGAVSSSDISGLGTMATQNANNVAITGGTIDGTTIGGTTKAAGSFTNLTATGTTTLGDGSGADTLTINTGTASTSITGDVTIDTPAYSAATAVGGLHIAEDPTAANSNGTIYLGRKSTETSGWGELRYNSSNQKLTWNGAEFEVEGDSPAYMNFAVSSDPNKKYAWKFNPDVTPKTLSLVERNSGVDTELLRFGADGSLGAQDINGTVQTVIASGGKFKPQPKNLISNGSFETPDPGAWQDFNLGFSAQVATAKYGSQAASVKAGATPSAKGIKQAVYAYDQFKGQLMTLTVWARRAGAGAAVNATVGFDDGVAPGSKTFSATTTYQQITYTFTTDAAATKLEIYLYGAGSSSDPDIYYDGATLVQGPFGIDFTPGVLTDTGEQTIFGDLTIAADKNPNAAGAIGTLAFGKPFGVPPGGFDPAAKTLKWVKDNGRFEFNQDLFTAGNLQLQEIASPATPAAANLKLYALNVGGVTRLSYKDSAGTQTVLTASSGGTVTSVGTGTGLTGGPITSSGTISLDYSATLAGNPTLSSGQAEFASTGIIFEGSTADTIEGLLTVADPTVTDKTWTLPNTTGTLITSGDTDTITSTMITDGTVANTDINASAAIAFSKLAALTSGNILVGSAGNVATSVAMSGDVAIANTGATTIQADSVALTTDTTGNYVTSVATSSPLSGGAAASEGATLTLGLTADGIGPTQIDETATYAWSGANTHSGANTFSKINAAGAGANAVTLSGTLGAMDAVGPDVFRGLYLNYTNANHTGGSAYGLDIAGITQDADATEYALQIGSGWDRAISATGTDVFTFGAGDYVQIDGSTTANTTTAGILDINDSSSTTNHRALDLSTTFTATGAATSYSFVNAWASSVVVAGVGVSQTGYGDYVTATKTGADTATGTYTLYGTYGAASNTGSTDAGTKTTYGGYFTATGDTAGTATATGLYASATGADSNYAALFAGGNVGIGDTTPVSLLTVGNGDLFQVNSSGDLVKVNNVTYTWPASQGAASTLLTNNGSGTLTWTAPGSSGIGDITGVTAGTGLTGGGASGDVTLSFDYTATLAGNPTMNAGEAKFGTTGLLFEGATADLIEGLLTVADPTGTDKTWTLPNTTGTLITTGDTGTVTNTMLAGLIAASKLIGTDIATVGTITSGTWNGTRIGAAYGGTGIDTSASTGIPSISSGTWSTVSTTGSGNVVLATSPTVTTPTVSGNITYSGTQPKRTIVLTAAGAIVGSSSSFADQRRTDGTNLSYYTTNFVGTGTTVQKAFWQFVVPDSYTGTTANVTLYWLTSSTTTTNGVKWFVDIQGLGTGQTLDTTYAGQGSVTSNPTAVANQVLVTSEITGITTGWTSGELATVKVSRDPADAADTETADAKLLLVKIEWTASAESD